MVHLTTRLYYCKWVNGIHRDIHSHGNHHDDGGGSRDSRRGDSHHHRIHNLHHIRGHLQGQWLLPQQTLQVKNGVRQKLTLGMMLTVLQKYQRTSRENTNDTDKSNEEEGLHFL